MRRAFTVTLSDAKERRRRASPSVWCYTMPSNDLWTTVARYDSGTASIGCIQRGITAAVAAACRVRLKRKRRQRVSRQVQRWIGALDCHGVIHWHTHSGIFTMYKSTAAQACEQ